MAAAASVEQRREAFAARRAARVARLERAAARARAEGESRIAGAQRLADRIPLGQPILVGHHSERRARRDAARIRDGFEKGFARLEEGRALERRAASAEANEAISSDDPDAIAKLRAELDAEEAFSARWKAINAAVRRKDAEALRALALDAGELRRLELSVCGTGYMVTNAAGRIRRLKQRLAVLVAQASRPEQEPLTFGDVRVSRDTADNRVRIVFPGKPEPSVISELKRNGFRFSPTAGAWQRHDTEAAWYQAKRIAEAAGGAR